MRFVLLFLFASVALGGAPEQSVIKIMTFSQRPDWDEPWNSTTVHRSSGTGFVIAGHRIMTNAHVVSWAKQILVRRYQNSRPYLAKVGYIGHDCDLALLEVQSEEFFDGIDPLEWGELPKVRSTVVTYGYPAGGEQISYTSGVVSRIELQSYTHIGNRRLIAAQTDAAINPGNSGGPVIQDGKVVGVAFQGIPGLENTGFFVPAPISAHFLTDVDDGVYDGFPQAGIRLALLQNPAQRRYLKLDNTFQGARIDAVLSDSAKEYLQEDDVLLDVAGFPVGSDGTILYRGNQLYAGFAFSHAQQGDKVPLTIWRRGKALHLDLPVYVNTKDHAEGNLYKAPRYFVYAGLVFTPLTKDYLTTLGRNWSSIVDTEILYELFYRRKMEPETARPEPIMLARTLEHSANADMTIRGRVMVDTINGIKINRLEDVIRAFEEASGEYHIIRFVGNYGFETLDRKVAEGANESILRSYGIQLDRNL